MFFGNELRLEYKPCHLFINFFVTYRLQDKRDGITKPEDSKPRLNLNYVYELRWKSEKNFTL